MIGYFYALFTVFVWGITFVSTKYLLTDFSPFEIMFIRYVMGYVGLFLMMPKKLILEEKKNEIWFVLAGLTGVVIYQLLENVAIDFTIPANVSIIVSICPMFTAILAQIIFKEKHLNIFFNIGFLIAICGIILVCYNGMEELHLSPKGDLLALGAALCWACYSNVLSKINNLGIDTILVTRRIFFWSIVFMIPVVFWGMFGAREESFLHVDVDSAKNVERFSDIYNWLNLIFLGILASALAFAFWNLGCKKLGTVKATAFIYLSPVITIVFGWIFLGDSLGLYGIIGTVLTIGGLILSEKKTNER